MIPRIIWMFWKDIEIPINIQNIIDHNKKVLTNWEIIILNKKTIHDYIPKFPTQYKAITVQQQSDWIRLYLLKTYGGIWSDISIIYNDVAKIDELWKKSDKYDYTGFFYKDKKHNGIYEIIETWFILCKKNSTIITLWLNEYERAMSEGFLNYKRRIIKEGTKINENNFYPYDIYFVIYYCLQHVLQNLKTIPKMNLLNAHDSMYFLAKKCGWHNKTCRRKLFKTKKYKLPHIKLTRVDRSYLKLK